MKFNSLMNSMKNVADQSAFKVKQHSPEILIVTGVVGIVASTVLACKATIKATEVLDESKEVIDKIHECEENKETETGDEYTQEDKKSDLVKVYAQTGFKLAKIYAPSVILGGLSLTGIVASHNILKKRNVALAAAYATVDSGFKAYRNRVVDRFGEQVDRELKNNVKAVKVSKTVVDEETGKETKVKENQFVCSPSDISGYARFFEKYTKDEDGNVVLNENWQPNNELNMVFLKTTEQYFNQMLRIKKRIFLNEVYDRLGLPQTQAGQVVGWIYDIDNPVGDNYIDFGMYNDNLSYSDYVNGYDPAILLDFNVDGDVMSLMRVKK